MEFKDAIKILKFLYFRDIVDIKSNLHDIVRYLGTFYPSTKKMVKELEEYGLLIIEKVGREYVIKITEKGKAFVQLMSADDLEKDGE